MGGKSTSTTTQQSQTAPWQAAQPMLQGILNQGAYLQSYQQSTDGLNYAAQAMLPANACQQSDVASAFMKGKT